MLKQDCLFEMETHDDDSVGTLTAGAIRGGEKQMMDVKEDTRSFSMSEEEIQAAVMNYELGLRRRASGGPGTCTEVMNVLRTARRPLSVAEMDNFISTGQKAIQNAVQRLVKDGRIVKVGRGKYELGGSNE